MFLHLLLSWGLFSRWTYFPHYNHPPGHDCFHVSRGGDYSSIFRCCAAHCKILHDSHGRDGCRPGVDLLHFKILPLGCHRDAFVGSEIRPRSSLETSSEFSMENLKRIQEHSNLRKGSGRKMTLQTTLEPLCNSGRTLHIRNKLRVANGHSNNQPYDRHYRHINSTTNGFLPPSLDNSEISLNQQDDLQDHYSSASERKFSTESTLWSRTQSLTTDLIITKRNGELPPWSWISYHCGCLVSLCWLQCWHVFSRRPGTFLDHYVAI